jgi:hypothetical protein
MQELLDKLQESPPQTEEELQQILSDTGYDIVPTEGGGEGEELPEEGGEEEEGGESPGEEIMDALDEGAEQASPFGMGPPPKTVGMQMTILRKKAAKNAMGGKKKKKNSEEDDGD